MKNWNFFVKLAIIVFLVFGVVTSVELGIQISELEDKVTQSEEQIEVMNNEIEELFAEFDRPVDPDYIKKIARESLGYHLPAEIVFYNDMAH